MGKKSTAKIIAVLLILSKSMVVRAETVDDLYSTYSIVSEVQADDTDLQVVKDYDTVKKFVAMYNYIDLSVPDTDSQDRLVRELTETIEEIDKELVAGYDLSFSEILDLESRQSEAYSRIQRVNSTRNFAQVEIDVPEIDSVPTYDEYIRAKQAVNDFELSKEIGDVSNIKIPTTDASTVSKHSSLFTVIDTGSGSGVTALWKGTVSYADSSMVIIDTVGDVEVTYKNLTSVGVSEGDKVTQYQRIGFAADTFSIMLQIDSEYYDIGRILN